MKTKTFTEAALNEASAGHAVQRDFRDTVEAALCVRVGATTKTFFTAASVARQRFHKTLGHWPAITIDDARTAAGDQARLWQALREGRRPATPADVPTLQQATERHIADSNDLRRRKKQHELTSAPQMRADLERHFPAYWKQPVTMITADVVHAIYKKIPSRTLACLRAALRVSVGKRVMPDPLIELPRGVIGASGKTLLISELRQDPTRFKSVLTAIRSYPNPDLRVFFEFLAFSGRRPDDLRRLLWTDIDLQRSVYFIRGYKGAADLDDFIAAPLHPHMVTVLTAWAGFRAANPKHDERDLYVFPASQVDTAKPHLSVSGFRGVAKHIRSSACFKTFTAYQLRKFFSSTATNRGVPDKTVDLLTGHSTGGIRGRYSFGIAEQLREPLATITTKLLEYAK